MKRLLSFILAIMMISSLSVTALAEVSAEANDSEGKVNQIKLDEPTRQEETEWCFRIYQGRWQMRLWSITYGKWLTDWIDIGPA